MNNITNKLYYDALYQSATPFVFVAPGRNVSMVLSARFWVDDWGCGTHVDLHPRVLSKDDVADFRRIMDGCAWEDGRSTAGAQSALVKSNEQLPPDSEVSRKLGNRIVSALTANPRFISAAIPLLAGADVAPDDACAAHGADWAQVVAGPWLAETLKGCAVPQGLAQIDPGEALQGTLRPYQQVGVRWLYLLRNSAWGRAWPTTWDSARPFRCFRCCWFSSARAGGKPQPSLLVAPASLLANWASEIERFAPGLKALIAHPSALPAAELKALDAGAAARTSTW